MWATFVKTILILTLLTKNEVKANSSDPSVGRNKPDERTLKEIADLRNELNEAFEKDIDMKTSGGKGVIVQPSWTQEGNIKEGSAKVVVTQKNLKDTAAIRKEIQHAIKSNTYVKGEELNKADQYFAMHFRSKNVLTNLIGTDNENFHDEEVGFGIEEESDEKMPNIVESHAFENVGFESLKRLKMSTRRTREELVLQEIIEDINFDFGEDVREWKHIEHDGKEYFIGLREFDLIVVEKHNLKYANSKVLYVNAKILYLESYCFWNRETKRQTGMIMVAAQDDVLWYQPNNENPIWKWSTGMPINGLKYFKIDQEEYLAISSDMSARSEFSSLNIYQFDLRTKEFWIVQKLQLEDTCSETIFLDTGRDVFLAVVQNNSAAIFTFNPHADMLGNNLKFELKSVIDSEGIQSISGFQMGGLSYLALGGLTPKILHYTRGEFVPKTIFGQNFGLVELFLPIPARTYRDDLILLVQHRVVFDSHDLVVLEALIWNGEVFETTTSAPCVIGNQTFAFGFGCMLDIHRESGIKGSAILKRDNDVFLIVPRHKAPSGLFHIKTELLSKNSELVDLGEIFNFLKEWVKEQETLIEEAYNYLQDSSYHLKSNNESLKLSNLKTPELDFNGSVSEIFINEHQWTEADAQVNLEELIDAIERLNIELNNNNNNNAARKRRHLTYETLDFDNIEADEVNFQLLNGEQSFIRNSQLIFLGTVSFENLNVLNEIQLSSTRFVRESSIEMGENLNFTTINNVKWSEFIEDLIFRNIPVNIGKLQSLGEVICEGIINVQRINGLKFPANFLWSNGGIVPAIVKGNKFFLQNLISNAIDTGGPINGINPFDMISLSENERIAGNTIFKNLEVTEKMTVNGTTQGKSYTEFPRNPTLYESNIIQSACNFFQLEVKGPIYVAQKLNENDLNLLLSDVIYRPSTFKEILIESTKFFNWLGLIDSNLKLNENILNGTQLDTFVTKNGQQELYLEEITGNFYFNSLVITGLFDSISIMELTQTGLLIDEGRSMNCDIQFMKPIFAQSINIVQSLNEEKQFTAFQDDVEFQEVFFKTVEAKILSSECDFTGNGIFNGMHLKLSHKNQSSILYVKELILSNGLQAESLHYINTKSFISFLEKIDNIPAMIREGKILVEKINVDGNIQVNKLDSYSFDEDIQMSAIWLCRPNFLRTKLKFQEQLILRDNLVVSGSLNEFQFPYLINDMVYKSTNFNSIVSSKDFLASLRANGDIIVGSVNEIDFSQIATKQTTEVFHGIIEIKRDLTIVNLEITEFLNNFPIGNFIKTYGYDSNLKTVILNAEIAFEKNTRLENLYIFGKLNSIGNVDDFFENIVYKNNICMLKGKTTFKGNTFIEKGAYIKNINGHNVVQLMKNMVFIDDPVPIVIFAPVLFKDIATSNDVTVKRTITTTKIMGCQLNKWLSDTLRTNKIVDFGGLVKFAFGCLEGNSVYSVTLNGMDLDYVVTLHTNQNLPSLSVFSNIHLGIFMNANGVVNAIDLKTELQNTLMQSGNQHIRTPLTMQSCTVVYTFEATTINNNEINLKNLATLNENLGFNSPLFFSQAKTSNIKTNDLISGIYFSEWQQKALLKNEESNLFVRGNWNANDLHVKFYSIIESSPKRTLMKINNEIYNERDQIFESFGNLCQSSMKLTRNASKKIYFPRYLEKSYEIVENQIIHKVFIVSHFFGEYIIINVECQSKVYEWNTASQDLELISTFDSGPMDEVFSVPIDSKNIYLVNNVKTRSENCLQFSGIAAWNFSREQIFHIKKFNDFDISTIHHSGKNEDSFYAVDEKNRKVFQLTPNLQEKRAWTLPPSEKGVYRFLPNEANLGIALTNGQQILLLNRGSHRQFRRRRHSQLGRNRIKYEANYSPSKFVGKQLSFSELSQILDRSLRDLIRRLNIELTDLNYTLSEDEFQDEHLQQDFIRILDEINIRNIFPQEISATFFFEGEKFSLNLVQKLAAKVLKVIWPVFVEIGEMRSQLKKNDYAIHSDISNSLSSIVYDILQIVSEKNVTLSNYHTNIQRILDKIQNFQKRLLQTIDNLEESFSTKTEELSNKNPVSIGVHTHTHVFNSNMTLENLLDEPFIGQAVTGRNLLVADSPHLPAQGAGEIVSIKTGFLGNFKTLIAVTEPKDHIIAKETDSVRIFFDVITGSLFQTISAYKPSCLASKRIEDESLLAFVEDRQTVRVLIYKGIQGFIELHTFKETENIVGLQFIILGNQSTYKVPKTFLMVIGQNNVKFYEVVMFGDHWVGGEMQCNLWESR